MVSLQSVEKGVGERIKDVFPSQMIAKSHFPTSEASQKEIRKTLLFKGSSLVYNHSVHVAHKSVMAHS